MKSIQEKSEKWQEVIKSLTFLALPTFMFYKCTKDFI